MKNVCRNGQLDVFKFFVNCLEENVLEKNVLYLLPKYNLSCNLINKLNKFNYTLKRLNFYLFYKKQ